MDSITQSTVQVKLELYQQNRDELLHLADIALEQFNRHWAAWIATGDSTAYRLAVALARDRETLLAHLNNRIRENSHGL